MRGASVFDDYATDSAAKFDPARVAGLAARRLHMWDRALRPLRQRVTAARSILDYGCGQGEFLGWLRARTRARLAGYDPSRTQLAAARKRLAGTRGLSLAATPGGTGTGHDLVFCHHVIEHVSDEALPAFARDLTRRVAPGGRLVIATPNGLNPLAYAFFMSADKTHTRLHSAFSLAEVLRPVGFEIETVGRELPQAYDLPTAAKWLVWAATAAVLRVGMLATAGGIRGLRYPLTMAATFWVSARRIGAR